MGQLIFADGRRQRCSAQVAPPTTELGTAQHCPKQVSQRQCTCFQAAPRGAVVGRPKLLACQPNAVLVIHRCGAAVSNRAWRPNAVDGLHAQPDLPARVLVRQRGQHKWRGSGEGEEVGPAGLRGVRRGRHLMSSPGPVGEMAATIFSRLFGQGSLH